MLTSWIKRSSLKRSSKSKKLVVDGAPPSMITLLTLSALLVLVGVFVVQQGMAANWWRLQPPARNPLPEPSGGVKTSVSPSVTPTPSPTHIPLRTPPTGM